MNAPAFPARVLLGLSGGADSVALLLMLTDAKVQITAVHVNHGLRGDDADGDEAFVRELCAGLNVPLLTYRLNPPENPGEAWARDARYACYRQAARESGVNAIALAHHQDDQAETVLMHLLRGSGLTGLTGMQADTTVDGLRILRPLLRYTHAELAELLVSRHQPWREDATNRDPRYLRNAIRRDVLPLLTALNPEAAAHIAGTAEALQADEAVLSSLTGDFLRTHADTFLPLDALKAQLPGMLRRILRAWWTRFAPDKAERVLTGDQTMAVCALVDAPVGSKANLPGGRHAYRGFTHLHLICPDDGAVTLNEPAMVSPRLTIGECGGQTGDGLSCQAMPRALLAELTLRTRRNGDWLRPFGFAGRKKLQDYLTDRRVDAPFRDRIPLLCRGSEVLLVGGVGAGDIPPVTNDDDSVMVRWNDAFPWQTR